MTVEFNSFEFGHRHAEPVDYPPLSLKLTTLRKH